MSTNNNFPAIGDKKIVDILLEKDKSPVRVHQIYSEHNGVKKLIYEYCKHTELSEVSYSWDNHKYNQTHDDTCEATATCLKCGKVFTETSTSVSYWLDTPSCRWSQWKYHVANFPSFPSKQCKAHYYKAALAHTPGSAATCTTPQTCTVCGKELAAATGQHTYGASLFVSAATCTTAQLRVRSCTECGYDDYYYAGSPLGHSTTSRVTKEATCVEAGTKEYYCSRCYEVTGTETIPATGVHDWTYYYYTRKCKVCGLETYQ
jgi:hypothetical protein